MAAGGDTDGWVVALADMPCIGVPTLRRVAEAIAGGAALAAPVHAGRRGHPVGFAARWKDALLALEGDEGARAILRQHAALLQTLQTDDPGVLQDVDTPADLAALRRMDSVMSAGFVEWEKWRKQLRFVIIDKLFTNRHHEKNRALTHG